MLQVEKAAVEIKKYLESLGKHFGSYNEAFNKIGNYLDLSVKSYLDARHEYRQISRDVKKITDGKLEIKADEIKEIDRPMLDE